MHYSMNMMIRRYKNKIEYVSSGLRRQIAAGKLKPGMRLASSAAIAQEFSVSLMTADRAIRQLAAEGLLKRITGCGTFIRSNRETLLICIKDPVVRNSLFQRENLYRENTYPIIEREFLKYDAKIQYVKTWEKLENLNPDGILCSDIPPPDFERKVPIALFLNYRLFDEPLIQCVPDLQGVMLRICSRLAHKKIRRIYVTANPASRIRYFANAFLSWLEKFGLKSKVEYSEASITAKLLPFHLGYQYGMGLPDVHQCVIFATSDFRASGILKALDERGFRPGEYDLISCNNWEAYGYHPFPRARLTSIDFRREECLREIVRLLCETIRQPQEGQIRIVKFPAVLKIRESGLQ